MMFKAHRKTIIWTVLVVVLISTYDVLLHALLAVGHIAFEWFELGLEELIEHVFHTTRHQSQIIVFYLLLCLALLGMYWLWRALPRITGYLRAKREHCMADMSCYWRECSSLQKAKLVTTCTIGVTGLCFWMFM